MQKNLTEEGRFETVNASRYLQQLCKHFAHRVEVRFDAQDGTAMLPAGPATLKATGDALTVTLTGDDATGLEKSRHVIDSHLERFAFREGFTTMQWSGPRA
ncbi:DUF2218 domain-containing protein [Oceaniglobus trochenteri]|uniref:DUF2218 domain-containing protein n=1 Tax=Oceaniglobus trochenteri TaxID=2763260 RepID=UPI001CFFD031|nr:DUF2218 domain-containing protein [Oceaniglobus trochenteri]